MIYKVKSKSGSRIKRRWFLLSPRLSLALPLARGIYVRESFRGIYERLNFIPIPHGRAKSGRFKSTASLAAKLSSSPSRESANFTDLMAGRCNKRLLAFTRDVIKKKSFSYISL